MRWWGWLIVALIALPMLLGAYVYVRLGDIDSERIGDDVWVLFGLGGNVTVLRTDAGSVIVDAMTVPLQGSRIRANAEALTGAPVVVIVNTHYHLDHTGGNPGFDAPIRVLATERTLHHLQVTAPERANKPNEVFVHERTLRLGGKTIELVHPGRGHTDGDLVALFVEDRVLVTGDLLFNHLYPNIDLEAGGSVQAWGDSLDNVLELDFDTVVPGHGAVTDRAGLEGFQRFMRQLAAIGRRAAERGDALEATLATTDLTEDAGYEEISLIVPIGLDRQFVLRRAWEEATGNFEARD